ncbi:enoyl-CoA hydratase [Novosphingobium sp. FSY-8]|uniref:Enoyl-CoA hydratase n=1 Tax=Novosphingobium ovatum TaxID=1908523 RepID=A0ABW9XHW5_9SPHN|nr:enoyl-CoA hydratase-related protein [Novosphingobium ovatum]NBC38048.1 enoyl-CoA hydratase [Novosphingobium ovatum]
MTAPLIRHDVLEGGIAHITLSRPAARNALTLAMVSDLRATLAAVEADPAVRVVVLSGEGKAFCAGLDLKAVIMGDEAPQGAMANMALQELYAGLMLQVHRLRQPVIAAVQGAAVGAGMGLALAADVRVAGDTAQFLVGAVRLGLSAGECGISYHLPRLIGAGRAFDIMLTGRPVLADEAAAIGLASRVVADDALLDAALDTARMIAGNAPFSIKHTKQVMWANLEAPSLQAAIELENHVQVTGLLSADFAEACAAFAAKRPPVFRGE